MTVAGPISKQGTPCSPSTLAPAPISRDYVSADAQALRRRSKPSEMGAPVREFHKRDGVSCPGTWALPNRTRRRRRHLHVDSPRAHSKLASATLLHTRAVEFRGA
ncbi:hypothetical protein HYPSUDRAFT_202931 [Hypholoma sublateritium FD-334 SS-4]|uniref:Uncharacterized protein n=1 Tax=Hypholoma sublateritium (strain FD-334 SS-4) TaxID=945553 RepID=A0A0D2L474_HYPSF|nr:hypothetical protein HYPSUDRAFT_202931 [Hypholoma sublateritium FD-334 SS-4]